MKLLDKYIIKKFLGTFIFILLLIMGIAVIFDITEEMDDYLDYNISFFKILYGFYPYFIVFYSNLFSSLIVFISVVWFTGKLSQNSETVAVFSSGVSFKRFLLPFFISATFIVAYSLYMNHMAVPIANKKMNDFEMKYNYDVPLTKENNIHRELKEGKIVYAKSYDTESKKARYLAVETWKNNQLKKKLFSRIAKWDTIKKSWHLRYTFIRKINGEDEDFKWHKRIDTSLGFTPELFPYSANIAEYMPTPKLKEFIKEEAQRGSNK
ncbi:MAG: LptF/LptG family permease, partial [Flavobacteriales bacterium]